MPGSKASRFLTLLEFSFHSLSQAYGQAFVQQIVMRHPLRTLRGLWAYARPLGTGRAGECLLLCSAADDLVQRAVSDGARLLVATGFCQKPLRAAGSACDCPAGRFNHDCLYLSRLDLNLGHATEVPAACAGCSIGVLGHAALQAGASFAVLTSALDIAQDILLPALEERRFTHVLFAICPYSLQPLSLALLICGLQGGLFPYDSGACADYRQWLRADRGDKPERTMLSNRDMARLVRLLEAIAAARREQAAAQAMRYVLENNVFGPR